ETKDGNVFVYKMKAIKKITHSASQVQQPTEDQTNHQQTNTEQTNTQPTNWTPVVDTDPNAKFSKFGLLLNAGFWAPGVISKFNNELEAGTGSTSYDYIPGWVKAGMGLGWFTNGFGLKWDFQFSLEPNNYQTDWYYGGYYAGTTEEDTFLFFAGTELEADLDFDSVVNKNNVTSLYVPVIVGIWDVEWNYSDSAGNTEDFSNTTTDFGTGIGFRGFDSGNFLWDIQCVYRFNSKGNYLTDASGYRIPDGNGSYIDAEKKKLELHVSAAELKKRRSKWKPIPNPYPKGVLGKYVRLVSSASEGAVTDEFED
ncbi:MAG TPA: dihydroxy-acid dehydratase, partial [bacterium]|nr:dihydroxy-acid dehydratase [bacterium]